MRELPRPTTGRLLKNKNKISINITLLLLFIFTLLASPLQAAGELIDINVAAMPAKSAFASFRTQTGFNVQWSGVEVTDVIHPVIASAAWRSTMSNRPSHKNRKTHTLQTTAPKGAPY